MSKELHQTTLKGAWRLRYWLARMLINAGRAVMPDCRYKRELNAALWTLGLKVQATVAANRSAKLGGYDV